MERGSVQSRARERKIGPIGEKHRQQKHPSEDQNGQVPKTKMKNEPIALVQLDQKQLKRHLGQKDEEKWLVKMIMPLAAPSRNSSHVRESRHDEDELPASPTVAESREACQLRPSRPAVPIAIGHNTITVVLNTTNPNSKKTTTQGVPIRETTKP